ncbi:undecaprenyl-phosphate 4-deoxy-4-formamido-L-arabinose transferase [bacterium BMS3Abin15]|nr:undecaprenyl-phosphate 4-deoxy-4-formamido-L-arabinose transferase [bacterium BMS3Abin15]HDZ85800.1 glycosyltransferase [Candidatus Moranbacteria bacterium]
MDDNLYLSVVVPLYNEEGNVKELHKRIAEACQKIGRSFEIIFVDDGSSDNTVRETGDLTPLKLIKFRKNFGQTAAFDVGIKQARGEIVVTMDGDLQNDPADISLLLDKMNEGYDIVSGWRWQRKDSLLKKIFSRGANLLRKVLVKDNIHDSGCSLKAYKRNCFEDIDLFGEMHRFIPAILQLQGFKVGEVKVSHHPRIHGKTKYNWKRSVKGLTDMIAVWFWRKYANRPLHLFGGGGILFSLLGTVILIWMAILKIFYGASLSEKIWPLVGLFLILVGIQLFVSGLLADIAVRNYYKSRGRMNYSIKEIIEK